MKKYFAVAFVAFVLVGCQSSHRNDQSTETSGEPKQPAPSVSPKPQTAETAKPSQSQQTEDKQPEPEKIPDYNWSASFSPLVANMLQTPDIASGSILLVDNVQNKTNGRLHTDEASAALSNTLAQSNKFTLVPDAQINSAKTSLGLSTGDSLGSRSKAISLARMVKAQYVLYSTINGNSHEPHLAMQLMLVQSGEIAWSGKGAVIP